MPTLNPTSLFTIPTTVGAGVNTAASSVSNLGAQGEFHAALQRASLERANLQHRQLENRHADERRMQRQADAAVSAKSGAPPSARHEHVAPRKTEKTDPKLAATGSEATSPVPNAAASGADSAVNVSAPAPSELPVAAGDGTDPAPENLLGTSPLDGAGGPVVQQDSACELLAAENSTATTAASPNQVLNPIYNTAVLPLVSPSLADNPLAPSDSLNSQQNPGVDLQAQGGVNSILPLFNSQLPIEPGVIAPPWVVNPEVNTALSSDPNAVLPALQSRVLDGQNPEDWLMYRGALKLQNALHSLVTTAKATAGSEPFTLLPVSTPDQLSGREAPAQAMTLAALLPTLKTPESLLTANTSSGVALAPEASQSPSLVTPPEITSSNLAANLGLSQPARPAAPMVSEKINLPMNIAFGQAQWTENLAERTGWLIDHKIEKADIQLDPPELGPIAVKIHMQNEQVSISFVAPNAQVKDAMEQSMARLKELLQEQGIALSHSDVSSQQQNRREASPDENSPSGPPLDETPALTQIKVSVPSRHQIDYFA